MTNPLVDFLPWDTDFFGFRIARVRGENLSSISQIDKWCEDETIHCLYFLCEPIDFATTATAEKSGFHFVDIRMTLDTKLQEPGQPLPANIFVRPSQVQDISTLQRIAGKVHRDTRFTYDPNFLATRVTELYEIWIKGSCEGKAEVVLVAEDEGIPVGYITCHLDNGIKNGSIGLVGVDSHTQGKGIGLALILNALQWFRRQDMQTISVVTQGRNYAAQRLYQRCGFRTQSVKLWYHKWYERT
jgi:dTDP-4-amino-4,6-dideoxy-D-galactose acyltransferase